jgi:hypothetical protein
MLPATRTLTRSAQPQGEAVVNRTTSYQLTESDIERRNAFIAHWEAKHGLVPAYDLPSRPTDGRYRIDERFRHSAETWYIDHFRMYISAYGLILIFSPYVKDLEKRLDDRVTPDELEAVKESASLNHAVFAVGRVCEGIYAQSSQTLYPDERRIHTVTVVFIIPLVGYAAEAADLAQQLAKPLKFRAKDLHPNRR